MDPWNGPFVPCETLATTKTPASLLDGESGRVPRYAAQEDKARQLHQGTQRARTFRSSSQPKFKVGRPQAIRGNDNIGYREGRAGFPNGEGRSKIRGSAARPVPTTIRPRASTSFRRFPGRKGPGDQGHHVAYGASASAGLDAGADSTTSHKIPRTSGRTPRHE